MRLKQLACGVILALCVAACATTQSGFRPLGATHPPKPQGFTVEIFESAPPSRPFERIARLDTHFEKTTFIQTSRADAIAELQKQARAAGADAIIEVHELRSRVNETFILHVTGIGIRYTDAR